ncbi:hypothetical protein [Halorhabdus rudnickae]|uniref:hypothetical protein n=1 Tax=Halorhabdus rudnickae TaxID=1775544 RepID=UPI001082D2F2|nr:hypothetical protein [Halorhabdus rudnickae]
MFDRVNELSASLIGGSGGDTDLSEDTFIELLRDDEHPLHVLIGGNVEHETGGRTTTVEPDGDHAVYLIVTDERVMIVLGVQPDTVEIEFKLSTVKRCTAQSGLLNKTLVVDGDEETIRFSPTGGDLEAVEDYVEQASDIHQDVGDALQTATDRFDTLESKIRDEGAGSNLWLRIQSSLSEARSYTTNVGTQHPLESDANEVTLDRLLHRVEDVQRDLQRRYVEAWLERGRAQLAQARDAREADDHASFCVSYTNAVEAAATLRNAIDRLEQLPQQAADEIEAFTGELDGFDRSYVGETRDVLDRAREEDDPETTAKCWYEAYRRYDAARAAAWDQTDGLPKLEAEKELDSIAPATVQALVEHADVLEEMGEDREDDDVEEARKYYERATERLRTAETIVEGHDADFDDRSFEGRIERLEEQIGRTKWEWGSPGSNS